VLRCFAVGAWRLLKRIPTAPAGIRELTERGRNVKGHHMVKPDPALLRRQGYHHGNLREALVDAARNLIAERGPAGFTLVEAARRASVSPAAPYRHFKDRDALVAEVCRRGFEEFNRRLSEAWVGADLDPEAGFRRMGQAYLAFAHAEPGYYSAMFAPGPVRTKNPLHQAALDSFAALQAAIARLTDGRPAPEGLSLLAYQIWALTHGIATLAAAGFLGSGPAVPTPNQMLDSGVGALIASAAAQAPGRRAAAKRPRPAKGARTQRVRPRTLATDPT
jgi:AcrR family transcriptional regulator